MHRAWLLVIALAVFATLPGAVHPASGGALVRTSLATEVGVVLDEIPPAMRARVAASLITKPDAFWIERARTQLRLTAYRLVFRSAFYENKQALPLPPDAVRHFRIVGRPHRHRVNGHDVVGVGYRFESVLVTDRVSPGLSEPRLRKVGGIWREPFVLPVDPELLFQRTGYACMDEADFPFNSVDSEQTRFFYDQDAEVEEKLSNNGQSHFTRQPTQSCVDALRDHVGKVSPSLVYKRLPWNQALADRYRYGTVTGRDPDLQIYLRDFRPTQTTYRYVHAANTGGCEVVEGSVLGTGWRRLLQFATSDENVGERDLTIGGVDYRIEGKRSALDRHHLYEFSACHRHYHFKFYGRLNYRGGGHAINSKKGFCLQSTDRAANRETSPLTNRFADCAFQGISPGWIDQYQIGISGQWVDSTELPVGTGTRTFVSNPYGFLCEGKFVDRKGRPLAPGQPVVWRKTRFVTPEGQPVEAPLCRLSPRWQANNRHSIPVRIERPGLGLINTPCTRGQIGPLRNCGFGTRPSTASCTPGARTTATFSIPRGAQPQFVRLTEYSHALKTPIPARYEDSYVPLRPGVSDQPAMLANRIVTADAPLRVAFRCPSPRTGGVHEPGGTYSVYTAPVFPEDPRVPVTRG